MSSHGTTNPPVNPGQILSAVAPGLGGGVLLPNTGGNTLLTVVAITSIIVGAAIVLSTIARLVAKRAYNKA